VLAIPVKAILSAALALRPHLNRSHLVLDVSSVKDGAVRDLTQALGREIPWIATHPLFGPTSIAHGDRPLVAVVCPNPVHPEAAARAASFFASLGCEVVEQDAEGHDKAMAATHALAFFVAKGLIDIRAGEDAPFVPPSFRAMSGMIDAVRSDASHLFATIQNDNPFAAESRARLLAALQAIDRDLTSAPEDPSLPAPRLTISPLPARDPEAGEAGDTLDDLDRELVQLLARRQNFIRRAERSGLRGENATDGAERWPHLLEARRQWAQSDGLDPEEVAGLFERILRLSHPPHPESE